MKWNDLVKSHAQDLATIMTAECGKPITESLGEVSYGAAFFQWFAEEAPRINGDVVPPNVKGQLMSAT
jgi:succinate-semialdehyde dehydrogenase/glutarate-semialdehyde dehydrogenase